jgi:hypothetical protein
MKKILPVAATGIALLAFPLVAADAKPGKGNGHGHGNAPAHAYSDDTGDDRRSDEARDDRREAREQRRAERRCKRVRKVGFSVRGTLAGFTAEDVTLAVVRANRHGRSFIEGDEHTFALEGARVKFEGVTDADGNGEVDFADVAPTDVVRATGKVARPKRGCDAEATVKLRKIHVERPEAEEAEES